MLSLRILAIFIFIRQCPYLLMIKVTNKISRNKLLIILPL